MAQWIGFTNQKLYQCRLLLSERDKVVDNKVLAKALEEGALHLLHDAWLSYLQELGEMVTFREPVSSLSDLLGRASMITGEMRELSQLADNGFSWLAQMLSAVDALNRQPMPKVQATDAMQLLVVAEEVSESQVSDWWRDLSRLIERQRENRQES
ncbi:DUF6586 family protein [Thalassolituus sp. LLYu03]|uniref:DUF6586 family protein n=1 Tax=Thalassolituus sp. LLYu03 TaxID=3421656 RepID=UPI003D28997B